MGNMIKVGMADLKACKCPDALTTLGLGSCVGVALYKDKANSEKMGISLAKLAEEDPTFKTWMSSWATSFARSFCFGFSLES